METENVLILCVMCCTFMIFLIEGSFNFSVNTKLGSECLGKLKNPEKDYVNHYSTYGKLAIAAGCLMLCGVATYLSLGDDDDDDYNNYYNRRPSRRGRGGRGRGRGRNYYNGNI